MKGPAQEPAGGDLRFAHEKNPPEVVRMGCVGIRWEGDKPRGWCNKWGDECLDHSCVGEDRTLGSFTFWGHKLSLVTCRGLINSKLVSTL